VESDISSHKDEISSLNRTNILLKQQLSEMEMTHSLLTESNSEFENQLRGISLEKQLLVDEIDTLQKQLLAVNETFRIQLDELDNVKTVKYNELLTKYILSQNLLHQSETNYSAITKKVEEYEQSIQDNSLEWCNWQKREAELKESVECLKNKKLKVEKDFHNLQLLLQDRERLHKLEKEKITSELEDQICILKAPMLSEEKLHSQQQKLLSSWKIEREIRLK